MTSYANMNCRVEWVIVRCFTVLLLICLPTGGSPADRKHQHDKLSEPSKHSSEITQAFSSTNATSSVLLAGDSKHSRYEQVISLDEIPRRHHAPSSVSRGVVAQVPPYRHEMAMNDELLVLNQVIASHPCDIVVCLSGVQ